MDHEEYILIEGKKIRRGRRLRTILTGFGNGLLSTFLFLTKMGLQQPIKYLLTSASVPLEVMNLIAQFKNLWDKQKPLWLFFIVGAISLGGMCLLTITDIVKWMGWTTGILASIAAGGMFFFTAVMAINMTLNLVGFIKNAKILYKHPEFRTPLRKVSLGTKATKTVCFAVLGALMIPFSLAIAANPLGATILISVMTSILLTLFAVKIAKTIRENILWKKTIAETKQDAYELLGVNRDTLQVLIQNEKKNKTPFLITLKVNTHNWWLSRFGTPEQKKIIEASKKNTAARYIEICYEYTLTPAKKEVDHLVEELEQHQKNLSSIYRNTWSVWWDETMRITAELQKAREQYEIQKAQVPHHPQLAQLQNVYDLLRKPRGRLKYEEAMKNRHTQEVVVEEKHEDRARLIEEALEAHQYHQIYKNEKVSHHHEIKSASMPALKSEKKASLLNIG